MPRIPLGVIACDRGANGIPTTNNPRNLAGRLKSYSHTIAMGFGFESLRISWDASPSEVLDWLNAGLMRPITSYSPSGRVVWDGLVTEITVTIGQKKIALALTDMANRISVRYSVSGGASGMAGPVTNNGSIALYGTKDRLINLSNVSASAAANRAATVLTRCAYPKNTQPSVAKTGEIKGITIEIAAMGWYGTLDWLITANSSTTVTATHTQVLTLLSTYNSTNNWFSTSSVGVTATGVSDVETIDSDSTYRDKIETVLALGNANNQPLHWGLYENRAITIEPWAGATAGAITYTESAKTGEIRDSYGNIVDFWDVRPNAMVQVIDVLESGSPSGAIDSIARKFVARVNLSLTLDSRSITLEGDDVATVDALIASPAGAGPAGHSDRQAKFERKIKRSVDTTHPSSGGGSGTIGIGSGGTGASDSTTARSNLGAAPNDARYVVTAADSELTAESNLGALTSGLLKQTVSGGVATLAIATAGADYVIPSTLAETIDDEVAGLLTAGAGIALTYNDAANTLTISATGGITGSGTVGRAMLWGSGGTAVNSNLDIDGLSSVLTVLASGAYTVTFPSTGTVAMIERANSWGTSQVFAQDIQVGTRVRIGLSNGTHQLELGADDAAKPSTSTWIVLSDARTKEILARYDRGLAFLQALPPVHVYRRNGAFGTTNGEIGVGFIAQELEAVAPEWIVRCPAIDDNGIETTLLKVQQHELSYVLLNAVLQIAQYLGLET